MEIHFAGLTMNDRNIKVKHRDDKYAEKYRTNIWLEKSDHENPFVETDTYCYGYSLDELANKVNFVDMLFLMLKGELPSDQQRSFLNKLMILFCHPGIRHEATRASILAGVGKTIPENILPAALLVFGGARTGAGNLAIIMRFISRNKRKTADDVIAEKIDLPGFAAYYGSKDVMAPKMATWLIAEEYDTPNLEWALSASRLLTDKNDERGLTKAAVVAAAFCDLGVMPRYGVGLYQLLAAPGLLMQGLEHSNKPATVLPFVADEDYELKENGVKDE